MKNLKMLAKRICTVCIASVVISSCFTACGGQNEKIPNNKLSGSSAESTVNEGKIQENTDFDFSEYESHGDFHDGIAWVCKSDYSGIKYGYINTKGDYIIPLTQEIKECYDYQNEVFIVIYESDVASNYGDIILYDKSGNELYKIEDSCAQKPFIKYFNNKNIYIAHPYYGVAAQESYMYEYKTGKLFHIDASCTDSSDYYDGLLYLGDYKDPSNAMGYVKGRGVCFADSKGNIVLVLSTDTNENYFSVFSASDFQDGKSNILFAGQNKKYYTVTIDKTGKWLNEPIEVDKNYKVR